MVTIASSLFVSAAHTTRQNNPGCNKSQSFKPRVLLTFNSVFHFRARGKTRDRKRKACQCAIKVHFLYTSEYIGIPGTCEIRMFRTSATSSLPALGCGEHRGPACTLRRNFWPRADCCGSFRGIAFLPARANQAHRNPKLVFFQCYHLCCCF